jgi:hypothetical protein
MNDKRQARKTGLPKEIDIVKEIKLAKSKDTVQEINKSCYHLVA